MKRKKLFLIMLTALALASASAAQRPALSLDGEWEFRFAPDDRGTTQQWYSTGFTAERRLRVPGCWDAQGVGDPTQKMRHNAIGVGWYRRSFVVPAAWQGRRVWLVAGGVHRTARIWINGQFVTEHIGYPVALRVDITDKLKPGAQSLVMAVDSRHDWNREPLVGTFDVIDFMDLDWGGIQEHVWLEATGETWIEDAFVAPDVEHRRVALELTLGGAEESEALASYEVRFKSGTLARGETRVGGRATRLALELPDAPLWTPDQPAVLTLDLKLARGGRTLDTKQVRFGLRKLEVREGHFVLNGDRFFLRGYGDDFNFPRELLPPADVGFWKKYLQKRRDFGFNAVRHHSMMPTESYLEAADDVGMLVQPELPIAYTEHLNRATPETQQVYKRVWRDYIRQMRNHPSIMAWCMGNEMWGGLPFGPELYKEARALDPTRLVIDSDGLLPDGDRPTLDYRCVQFDENSMAWGKTPGKYAVTKRFGKPVIVHEMGNLSCLPDPSEAARCDGAIKPFWLEEMQAAVKKQRLAGDLPAMLDASWRLQASLIKLNTEAARLGPGVDGYYQWLFRDYWCQSSGIESIVGTTRALTASMVRTFNSDTVILWPGRQANYRSGEVLPLELVLSDFRPSKAPKLGELSARLGKSVVNLKPPADVGGRGAVANWTGALETPRVRTPQRLEVAARSGDVRNSWPVWVWPAAPEAGKRVLVARKLSPEILRRLEAGASVLLTRESLVFPTQTASFKTAWWKGNEGGDFVHGNFFTRHPALAGFPVEGYGDLQTYGLLNQGLVVNLDEVPGHIEPIVWALDVPARLRRMAYLWEARVGKGRLLFSGFNLDEHQQSTDPASAWMYSLLTRYASGPSFQPRAELPAAWLRERVRSVGLPDPAVCLEGFDAVVKSTAEAVNWQTDRELNAQVYVARQTDGGRAFTWKTAAVPADWSKDQVTFVWSGGMGFRSEPEAGVFELRLAGERLCSIPFVTGSTQWACLGGGTLRYSVSRKTSEDTFGLFALTLPASRAKRRQPLELTLSAPGHGSRRWISVAPYRSVASSLAE